MADSKNENDDVIEVDFQGVNESSHGVFQDVIQGCSVRVQKPLALGGNFIVSCDIHGHLRTTKDEIVAWKEVGFHQGFMCAMRNPGTLPPTDN